MGNYIVAGPNEAKIISGPNGSRVVVGSCACQKWCCESSSTISLELMKLTISSTAAETTKGVRVDVNSIAQVKVKAIQSGKKAPEWDEDNIMLAAQHFLGDGEKTIIESITRTLEGHQRQILGTLTVEEVFKDRTAFAELVKEHVEVDLEAMGFDLVSYTISSIDDQQGYMESLGRTQTALVKREAQEGEALNNAARIKKVAQLESESKKERTRFESEAHVVAMTHLAAQKEADRDLQIKTAEYEKEVRVAQEKTKAAGEIERATQSQMVAKATAMKEKIKMQVNVEIAEQEALVNQRNQEGVALAQLLNEKNVAEGVRVTAAAEAERIRLTGEAEAAAIRAKGEAEASVLQEKAEAYKQYGEAALVQMVVEQLPQLASSIAAPLGNTDKMVFVSQDAQAGSMLTGDINRIISQLPETVEGLTGIDLRKLISQKANAVV